MPVNTRIHPATIPRWWTYVISKLSKYFSFVRSVLQLLVAAEIHCLFMIDCLFIVLTWKMCVCSCVRSVCVFFFSAPACDIPITLLPTHNHPHPHPTHIYDDRGGCVHSAQHTTATHNILSPSRYEGVNLMDLSCMRVLCCCFVLLKRSYDDFLRLNSLLSCTSHSWIWESQWILRFHRLWPKHQVHTTTLDINIVFTV